MASLDDDLQRRNDPLLNPAAGPAAPARIPAMPGGMDLPGQPPRPGPIRAVLGQRPSIASQFMPDTQAVLAGSGQDASANVGRGNYAGAVGSIARGAAAMVPAVANDVLGAPVRTGFDVAGRALTGLMGDPAQAATPPRLGPGTAAAAATLPPTTMTLRGPPAPANLGAPAVPVAAAAPVAPAAPAGQAVPGAPGAFRFVDASGRVLYTNQAGGAGAGSPAGNTVQAGAVAPGLDQQLATARAAAAARGEPLGPSAAAGNLPAGYGATIPGVNAPASQAVAELNERNARFDREVLADRLMRIGGRSAVTAAAGILTGHERNVAEADVNAQREAGSTERANITDTGQTLRERETGQRAAQTEGPLKAAQTSEAVSKAQQAAAHTVALTNYQKAVAGGNAKEIERAEEALRAAQGKYEKPSAPDNHGAIAVPGGVDPATGMATGSSVVIFKKQTGEPVHILSNSDLKNGDGGAQAKYEAGKVYRDAKGQKAKWDGSKFVPL